MATKYRLVIGGTQPSDGEIVELARGGYVDLTGYDLVSVARFMLGVMDPDDKMGARIEPYDVEE